jgi:hypothetical protein
VCVLSARFSLELSECKVCISYEVILDWIKLYKVRAEALGPKLLTGNRLRPSSLVWSGEDTLCRGRGDPLPWWRSSLVDATSRWPRELGKCLSGEPLWQVKWCSWERLDDWEPMLLCGVLQQHGLAVVKCLPIPQDKSRVKSLLPPIAP